MKTRSITDDAPWLLWYVCIAGWDQSCAVTVVMMSKRVSALQWLVCSRVGSFQRAWCRLKLPKKMKAASGLKSVGVSLTTSAMVGMVVNMVGGL